MIQKRGQSARTAEAKVRAFGRKRQSNLETSNCIGDVTFDNYFKDDSNEHIQSSVLDRTDRTQAITVLVDETEQFSEQELNLKVSQLNPKSECQSEDDPFRQLSRKFTKKRLSGAALAKSTVSKLKHSKRFLGG